MKRRSWLLSILAIILCLSLVLVGCGKSNKGDEDDGDDKNTNSNVNTNPENDKKVIANAINSFSIEKLLSLEGIEIPEELTNFNVEDVVEQAKQISMEVEATGVSNEGDRASVYLGIDNGIAKAEIGDRTGWAVLGSDAVIYSFTQDGNQVYENDAIYTLEEIFEMTEVVMQLLKEKDLDKMFGDMGMADTWDSIKSFKLPELSADQLELEGDYYVLSDSYYLSFVDVIADFQKDLTGETPTADEIQEAKDMLEKIIDLVNPSIGFAVVGENITGYMIGVDIDTDSSKFEDLFIGEEQQPVMPAESIGYYDEMPYATAEPMMAELEITIDVEAKIEVTLTDDGKSLKAFDAVVDADIRSADDEYVVVDVDASISSSSVEITAMLDSDMSGETIKADAAIEYKNDTLTIDLNEFNYLPRGGEATTASGNITVKALKSGDDVVGLEMNADFTASDGYDSVDFKVDAAFNFANITKAGTNLFEFDLELNMSEHGDMEHVKITANADVVESGVVDFTCDVSVPDMSVSVDGTVNVNSADLGDIPAVVQDAADNY